MQTVSDKPILLLVEDSEDDAFFFSRTLDKSGHACAIHHVSDGAAAINFLRDRAGQANGALLPSIIFLDLKMPVLNGFDVLIWLQQQPYAASVPVVVLSGSDQQSDKNRARDLGAVAYLVKPVGSKDFQPFLQKICPPCASAGGGN